VSRLPSLRRDELGEEGGAVWDSLTASRGAQVVTADGGLAGPFNAWVTAPEAGRRLADLGAHLRFGTSVDRRLLELAIVTVGAHWKAEFEWWAHSRMARQHGVSDAVLDALARGATPSFEAGDEEVVHAVASQLVEAGRIEPATYQAAVTLLGDQGMVELVTLCGYYTLVSFTLNAFAVPLPPGATPVWPEDDHAAAASSS
jgi:4-carboxymuconolactone decarboxylase